MVAALVEATYHGKRFDLVYALGPHAYHFVAGRRAAAYLSAPVIYLAMRDSTIEGLPALSNATGIISRFDLLETVRLAQLLQPDLKDLVVITGSSAFDRSRSEEHTSELQSLMRISYAVFCLKKKKTINSSQQKKQDTNKYNIQL